MTDSLPPSTLDSENSNLIISVQNVGKMYKLYDRPVERLKDTLFWRFGKAYGREFWALRNVSIDVRRGETVGILGRNGAGKSTLLQIIAGVLQPTLGQMSIKGRISALLELGSGFNPEYTGRDNVYMNAAILGLSQEEIAERYDEIVRFADIGQFIDQPVKSFSSGMVMRLGFSVASCIDPDVLIVDEALAVGDIFFQTRCFEKIKKLQASGVTTLFVTHDTSTFQTLCDYGYVLEKGEVFSQGKPIQVAQQYYELMREAEHVRQRLASAPTDHKHQMEIIKNAQAKEKEIQGKTSNGEYRFGTGGARIVNYILLDHDDHETTDIKVGSVFKVKVRIKFFEKIERLAVGILIRNAQGQNLMGMHTYVTNHLDLGIHLKDEEIEVTCEQILLLNPGEYVICLGLADHRSEYDFTSLDIRNNISKVTVYGKDIAYGLIHTSPIFYLDGKLLTNSAKQQTWTSMQWKDWTNWILEKISRYCPDAFNVLEIGGVGKELSSFVEGKNFLTLNFPDGDICKTTHFNQGAFDLILSKMTFEHLYDPFAASQEIKRLLAPNGIVIIITVWSWRYHTAPNIEDYWRFSTAGLKELFKNLEILEAGYDLIDRRKDCRMDNVVVDEFGGWREHWSVYLIAKNPD